MFHVTLTLMIFHLNFQNIETAPFCLDNQNLNHTKYHLTDVPTLFDLFQYKAQKS